MVEIETQKRTFLTQFKPQFLFKDMNQMGRQRAETHDGSYQMVPEALLVEISF